MAIKVVVVNGISFFTKTGRKGYDACKSAERVFLDTEEKETKMEL